MSRLLSNERDRFEQVILPHLDAAYNLACWLTGEDQDAEDVVQEALLRAFRFFESFRGDNGRAWLLTIVRNTAFTWMRQHREIPMMSLDEEQLSDESFSNDTEKALVELLDREQLHQAIAKLPIEYREVVILHDLEGLAYKEIAFIKKTGRISGLPSTGIEDITVQEVLSSHIRSLMASHLTDVDSTDQHTVRPWFDGKLDFIPPVVDLVAQDFPLIGGRLEYLDNSSVAALVYRSDEHVINLFIWPTRGEVQDGSTLNTPQGYHLIHWSQGSFNYWPVSDVEAAKLETFVQLIRAQVPN
jgi:RNA polymerase sigma factor (sigma-70 family)